MNIEHAKIFSEILKTLAHPIRILLVNALTGKDKCVSELTALANVDQSGISRHLAQLKKVGILSDKKIGKNVVYHLETPCILKAFGCAMDVIRAEAKRKKKFLKG